MKGWDQRDFIKKKYIDEQRGLKKTAYLTCSLMPDGNISEESVRKVLIKMGYKIRTSKEQQKIEAEKGGYDIRKFKASK